jgi:hypothetical protein
LAVGNNYLNVFAGDENPRPNNAGLPGGSPLLAAIGGPNQPSAEQLESVLVAANAQARTAVEEEFKNKIMALQHELEQEWKQLQVRSSLFKLFSVEKCRGHG